MTNPLLETTDLPSFDRIRAEHARPALEHVLAENRALVATVAAQPEPRFENVVVPLEEAGHRLSRAFSPIGHLNGVANTPELRAAYNECVPLLAEYAAEIGQSAALASAYRRILEREGPALPADARQLIANALRDFRLAGVDLPPDRQSRLRALLQRLATLGAKFGENVLDSARAYERAIDDPAQLAGLPPDFVARAAADAAAAGRTGWLLHLDQPTYAAVMHGAENVGLRRAIYEAWVTRASDRGPTADRYDNAPLIEEILAARHELARLLSFETFVDYALSTRMAKTREQVRRFLADLAERYRPAALAEFAELERFAGRRLDPWDIAFYSERLKRHRYQVSQEELRPYFPLPKVLEGLFAVATRLYRIRVRERAGVAVWDAAVRYFDVEDDAGRRIAGFYLDPYARPHKRSGAWMDECVVAKRLPTGHALPVAYLVCNFPPPVGAAPSLLTHDDVRTLFHEFGHGLHHMLTDVSYPSIAGINGVAWDAVELPSQFMENYVWRPEVLPLISAHVDSAEPLPTALLERLVGTRTFNAALDTLRQIELASFDLELHANYDPGRGANVAATLAEVRRRVAVTPAAEFNRLPSSFTHVFAGGYAAGYYSYKWAEVLAADAFEAFEEAGVFDLGTAGRFHDSILARGGSLDAMDAFVAFRGREPDVGALLRQTGVGG